MTCSTRSGLSWMLASVSVSIQDDVHVVQVPGDRAAGVVVQVRLQVGDDAWALPMRRDWVLIVARPHRGHGLAEKADRAVIEHHTRRVGVAVSTAVLRYWA